MSEQRRYRVWHPNHGEAEVVASDPYWALLAAAKEWGLRWKTIAKGCVITQLSGVPATRKENDHGMLTRRGNGITSGFFSGYKREDLVQKLGRIEHAAPALLEELCDEHCRFPMETDEYELPGICEACPVTRVMEMIE